MTPSASLLLLLLLGLTQAVPLLEEEDEAKDPAGEPEDVDITTGILTTNKNSQEFLLEGDLLPPTTRNALNCWNNECLWPKGRDGLVTIPYTISPEFNNKAKQIINSGLRSFHSVSCIRFVAWRNEYDYLRIESKQGCFSSLGRQGGSQVISVNKYGCMLGGIVQHELLHALGFRHEHNRSDRDSYVRINWPSIDSQYIHNFQKQNTNNLNVPYDYSSIMHYSKDAFSIDGRTPTIIPIPNQSVNIGQRRGLSHLDVQKLNRLYGCRR